jgi:guanylate kinase
MKGNIILVIGPTCAGKTTLTEMYVKHHEQFHNKYVPGVVISTTTRQPRENEINGVHYNFISELEFKELAWVGRFVEYELINGNYYGSAVFDWFSILDSGRNVIKVIDHKGAVKIKERFKDTYNVFIVYVDAHLEVILDRLADRKSSVEEIAARVEEYKECTKHAPSIADFKIYNFKNYLDETFEVFKKIVDHCSEIGKTKNV